MKNNINRIKLIISDVDGVWTDGSIYIMNDKTEIKKFSVLDGVGVVMAKIADIKIALISGRFSKATETRAKELNIKDVFNGTLNKLPVYENLKKKYKLNDNQIAYIGDDLIDISIMKKVAFPICVSNANVQVKEISVYKTKLLGGQGAFREAVEWILMKQGRLENIFSIMDQNVQKM
tara:strand:- start:55 stop:585 length:531 start_codon:yes stop_codon:yes gene_type:complete